MNSDCNPADVTFCFLVTRDLSKEHIWREWFECLARLQFKCAIVVHCSHKDSIRSDWLKQHLIPDECTREKLHPRSRTMCCETPVPFFKPQTISI